MGGHKSRYHRYYQSLPNAVCGRCRCRTMQMRSWSVAIEVHTRESHAIKSWLYSFPIFRLAIFPNGVSPVFPRLWCTQPCRISLRNVGTTLFTRGEPFADTSIHLIRDGSAGKLSLERLFPRGNERQENELMMENPSIINKMDNSFLSLKRSINDRTSTDNHFTIKKRKWYIDGGKLHETFFYLWWSY